MEEEQSTNPPLTNTPSQELKQPIKFNPMRLIIVVLIIAVVGSLAYIGKVYYSKLFVKAQNDIGNVQADVYWLNRNSNSAYLFDQVNYLTTQVNDLTAQLSTYTMNNSGTPYTYTTPSLDISTFKTYTPEGFPSGQKLLMFDFLAKNNTTGDIYFSSSNYKLKDNNDYQYQIYYGYNSAISLPDGRSWTDGLSLEPGEQTRGTMVFLLTRSDFTTLYLTDQSNGASIVDINATAL